MLSVLVASCPCALSLALPVVYAAASRRFLDDGILLTRGDSLHALTKVDTVVFDKTGTLTRGVPEITAVKTNPARPETDRDRALQIASAIESASAHPIARAFHSASRESGRDERVDGLKAKNVRIHPARGLEAEIEGAAWKIGTAEFALPYGRTEVDDSIWLADTGGWVACFELQDTLRDDAEATVRQLIDEDLGSAVLSGDSREAVERVAGRIGIGDWHARQSPEMKLQKLEAMRKEGKSVLMIGDGVNDAPILAAADVSMTVKGGAELANSAADLILTADSLWLVVKARDTARSARQLVRQNLTWAVLYNASIMPLAVAGMLKPWMAALGMSLSSLLVVANASRLVRKQRSATRTGKPHEFGVGSA